MVCDAETVTCATSPTAAYSDLCERHFAAFERWLVAQPYSDSPKRLIDWLAFIAREASKMMAVVDAECDHLRKRAREFKDGKINGYALANSVLKHVDLISKETV